MSAWEPRDWKPTWQARPERSAAASSRSKVASDGVVGFSRKTWLPWAKASSASSRWVLMGVQMMVMSGECAAKRSAALA